MALSWALRACFNWGVGVCSAPLAQGADFRAQFFQGLLHLGVFLKGFRMQGCGARGSRQRSKGRVGVHEALDPKPSTLFMNP